LLPKRNSDRAKKCLAPINQLKQYPVSNYHYEKIHLHPGQCRAPRGVRAKDRNDRAGGESNGDRFVGNNNHNDHEPSGNDFAVADPLTARLNPFGNSLFAYEEIYLSSRWASIAVGLRTKGNDRDSSAHRKKRKQYDSGEPTSSYIEQNGDKHDD